MFSDSVSPCKCVTQRRTQHTTSARSHSATCLVETENAPEFKAIEVKQNNHSSNALLKYSQATAVQKPALLVCRFPRSSVQMKRFSTFEHLLFRRGCAGLIFCTCYIIISGDRASHGFPRISRTNTRNSAPFYVYRDHVTSTTNYRNWSSFSSQQPNEILLNTGCCKV